MSENAPDNKNPAPTAGPGVALVTGATGGIGKEIVRGLLAEGLKVLVGVRSIDKGDALGRELGVDPGSGRFEVLQLDISNMQSIRAFAEQVGTRHGALHVLVNNAGAWFNERQVTPEGRELTLATNVLGPYLLSRLLLPLLQASSSARIVNVVSAAVGDFDLNDLEWQRRKYDAFKAYRQSKQALQMVTQGLAQTTRGTGVVVNAASPGFVRTSFLHDAKGLVATMLRAISFLAVPPTKGAETPLLLALSPALAGVTGRLYDGGREKAALAYEPRLTMQLVAKLDGLLDQASS